jgi:hypothetical protein
MAVVTGMAAVTAGMAEESGNRSDGVALLIGNASPNVSRMTAFGPSFSFWEK